MGKLKITNDIVDERLSQRPLQRIEDYIGDKKKILWKCLNCAHEWKAIPNAIFRGTGCPKCAGKEKITNEEFDQRIESRPVKRLSDYKGHTHTIKMECLNKSCLHVWDTKATYILTGSNCPKCNLTEKFTNEVVDNFIKERPIIRLDDYIDTRTKIRWKCEKCDHIWLARPAGVLKGQGCPKCKYDYKKLTNDRVDARIDPNEIERIGDVVDSKTKIEWKCKKCTNSWFATPNNILRDRKCPTCTLMQRESRLATQLKEKCLKLFPKCTLEYSVFRNKDTNRFLPYDIFVEADQQKYIIEIHGRQHFEFVELYHGSQEEFERRKLLDQTKKEWAIDNGFIYIEIPAYLKLKEAEKILNKIKKNEIKESVIYE